MVMSKGSEAKEAKDAKESKAPKPKVFGLDGACPQKTPRAWSAH